jgi:hypothetical protein
MFGFGRRTKAIQKQLSSSTAFSVGQASRACPGLGIFSLNETR